FRRVLFRSGGARVRLAYKGRETGEVDAGPPDRAGHPLGAASSDHDGRRIEVELLGALPGLALPELKAALEMTAQLGSMVGRRMALERERRLGTFLVELSRWLL